MKQNETSRERIMRKAITLFGNRGFRGTSTRKLASTLNMSISSIYYYFGNKEGLLLAILEDASELLLNTLNNVRGQELPPIERFRELVKAHLRLGIENIDQVKIFFAENLSPKAQQINREAQRSVLNIYREELSNLQGMGYVKHRNLTVLSLNIMSVVNGQLNWYRPDGSLSYEEVADEIINFILYGALGRSDEKKVN